MKKVLCFPCIFLSKKLTKEPKEKLTNPKEDYKELKTFNQQKPKQKIKKKSKLEEPLIEEDEHIFSTCRTTRGISNSEEFMPSDYNDDEEDYLATFNFDLAERPFSLSTITEREGEESPQKGHNEELTKESSRNMSFDESCSQNIRENSVYTFGGKRDTSTNFRQSSDLGSELTFGDWKKRGEVGNVSGNINLESGNEEGVLERIITPNSITSLPAKKIGSSSTFSKNILEDKIKKLKDKRNSLKEGNKKIENIVNLKIDNLAMREENLNKKGTNAGYYSNREYEKNKDKKNVADVEPVFLSNNKNEENSKFNAAKEEIEQQKAQAEEDADRLEKLGKINELIEEDSQNDENGEKSIDSNISLKSNENSDGKGYSDDSSDMEFETPLALRQLNDDEKKVDYIRRKSMGTK